LYYVVTYCLTCHIAKLYLQAPQQLGLAVSIYQQSEKQDNIIEIHYFWASI